MNIAHDLAARPLTAFFLWCVPLAIGVAASLFVRFPLDAAVWAICFAWMGGGCILNGTRCRRVHCYIAGPVLVAGAAVTGLIAAGILPIGPRGLHNTAGITLAVALLSFLPELVWRRYL
jgi:hypothetical protein